MKMNFLLLCTLSPICILIYFIISHAVERNAIACNIVIGIELAKCMLELILVISFEAFFQKRLCTELIKRCLKL